MALRLDDRWIWDFWLAFADGEHHVFYLQAPRSLGEPELRHVHATIGHAVSRDLLEWRTLPDVLAPAEAGAWDDLSIWTGSVVEHDGIWHLLYTGVGTAEKGLVQRVGLATSLDLIEWYRFGDGPVLEADPRWYELLGTGAWKDQSWRDPWIVVGDDGRFHALLTARSGEGSPEGRGVVGHAASVDLRSWEVLPPLTEPLGMDEVEVPQLVEIHGCWHLVFCGTRIVDGVSRIGTFSVASAEPFGHYDVDSVSALDADETGTHYAGKIVEHLGEPYYLAWRRVRQDGGFAGELADPVRVDVENGRLRLLDPVATPAPRTAARSKESSGG